jgi:zinc transporter 2
LTIDSEQSTSENVSVVAARIHAIGDAVQSVGASIAGLLIWIDPQFKIADPLCTLLFSIIVISTTLPILKSMILPILMEATSSHIHLETLREEILQTEGVEAVHDLHVWAIATGTNICSFHIVTTTTSDSISTTTRKTLSKLRDDVLRRRNIHRSTIQIDNSIGGFNSTSNQPL